jgi:hypothetical protein
MHYSKLFVHSVLLFTVPSLALYPQSSVPEPLSQTHETVHSQSRNTSHLSFDEILNLIDDLEDGELEKKCSREELETINHFMINLAKEGILPDEAEEESILNEDIYELLYSEHNPYEYFFSFDSGSSSVIAPAILYRNGEIILCKSWIHKKWDQTKKFVKKHKTAILIGAAIVVGTVIVIGVVSAATAASAGAAGAAAASGSDSKKEEKEGSKSHSDSSTSSIDIPSASALSNEAPVLKAAIDEHVASFKEFMREDKLAQDSEHAKLPFDPSFSEKARELGAYLAHETLEGISELVSVIPQLGQELQDIGSRIIPTGMIPADNTNPLIGNPKENFEGFVADGHQFIDQVFSTDQAEYFTSEKNASGLGHDYAIGILPPPSLLGEIVINGAVRSIGELAEAGKIVDRGGFNEAGRSLMKHGYRKDSVFPRPTGNAIDINSRGQTILEELLCDPNKKIYPLPNGDVKVYSSNGRGAYFKKDGSFRGFIEERYE